jgi:hypothetical protein
MRALKGIVSILLALAVICIVFIIPARMGYKKVSPDITVNSTSINSTGDQVIINYTLPNDFYSDTSSGKYLYIGFEYPAKYRGAFQNQYVPINQKAGIYSVILPYTKGLGCNIYVMTHYQAAWGRGVDEYVYKDSCLISADF